MGQLWLRSFKKLVTHQIAANTSAKHCMLSELSFPKISWRGKGCRPTKDFTCVGPRPLSDRAGRLALPVFCLGRV